MTPSNEERVPRLLEVDLGAWEAPGELPLGPTPWHSAQAALQALGEASGPALGMARFLDQDQPAPALILCVGDSVRRGLPTAARVSILAPSPLTGRLAEGQVGSDLGRRLAAVADALVVRGRTDFAGALLHIDGSGNVALIAMPDLVGADPVLALELVTARLGECALLRCGVGGEMQIPFANLAAGGSTPSFVGRGGLGAQFGSTGLKAIAITAAPVPASDDEALTRSLLASPRLRARGAGGTLELAHAFAARGDLMERGYTRVLDSNAGTELSEDAQRAGRERHGCKGCPTPCGWVFERRDGKRQGAHFSAVYALGTNLGLGGLDDALVLLEACDRLGLDAKEAGACLALYAQAVEGGQVPGKPVFGERDALVQLLEELAERSGTGALLSDGAAAFARAHGLFEHVYHAGGEAARPESSLASVLGQCVSARGTEPMRTFPFLLGDGADRERIRALFQPFYLPEHAHEARHPAGKGRLVWWHENLVAALDVTGFCAFSAAGLLADGLLDLDALARLVHPRFEDAEHPGLQLLELGADVVALHHLWNERRGLTLDERPAWAAQALARTGMLDEYRAWRGLDAGGRLLPAARPGAGSALSFAERDGTTGPSSVAAPSEQADARTSLSTPIRAPLAAGVPVAADARMPNAPGEMGPVRASGAVTLTGWGPLRSALGGERCLTLDLPAPVGEVLVFAAQTIPEAAAWLWRAGHAVPAVYRGRERLETSDSVHAGDVLELVVAVSGGST